jgi:hypothetical protein
VIPPRPDPRASRPDAAPSRPDVPTRRDLLQPSEIAPRRRRRWVVIVAIVLTTTLLATSVVAVTGNVRSDDPLVALGLVDPHGPHEFLEELSDGSPYRWDPCQPIHYELNLHNAPTGAREDAFMAAEVISEVTGIEIVFDGEVTRTAFQTEEDLYRDGQGGYQPVLISWMQMEGFREWAPRRALAAAKPWTSDGPPLWEYVSGQIVVNADHGIEGGWDHRYSLGPILLHEWGHVIGLAHVVDGDELMWSIEVPDAETFPDVSVTSFGPGDLEGLRALGIEAGCIDGSSSPSPSPSG